MRRRTIEIFSAGCAVCNQTISQIHRLACDSCEISVLDMNDATVAGRAGTLKISSVPAVVVDGQLLDCCSDRGISDDVLRASGIGQPIE